MAKVPERERRRGDGFRLSGVVDVWGLAFARDRVEVRVSVGAGEVLGFEAEQCRL
jgi:hypothetical protein